MKKTEYVINLIDQVNNLANIRSHANKLAKALQPLKERMEHKKALGLDPDPALAAGQIAQARAAINEYNQSVVISLASDEDILAGLQAAEADTPTTL